MVLFFAVVFSRNAREIEGERLTNPGKRRKRHKSLFPEPSHGANEGLYPHTSRFCHVGPDIANDLAPCTLPAAGGAGDAIEHDIPSVPERASERASEHEEA